VTEQQMPIVNDRLSIQSMVRADLERREQVGIERYGTPLQAFNGRDAARDLYEELLDAACYSRQLIEETVELRALSLEDERRLVEEQARCESLRSSLKHADTMIAMLLFAFGDKQPGGWEVAIPETTLVLMPLHGIVTTHRDNINHYLKVQLHETQPTKEESNASDDVPRHSS
jgi:hypothetical protein